MKTDLLFVEIDGSNLIQHICVHETCDFESSIFYVINTRGSVLKRDLVQRPVSEKNLEWT